MRLQTTADETLDLLVLTATGVVDEHSSDALRRVFETATGAGYLRMLVDLTGLDDVNPAVAGTFLQQDELLTERGGWLWLVHGTEQLAAALRATGVSTRVRTPPRVLVCHH